MANKEYVFTYRCRYCGKVFGDCITGEALATRFLVQIVCELTKDAQCPGEKTTHYAEDHIGIADLMGCEKRSTD